MSTETKTAPRQQRIDRAQYLIGGFLGLVIVGLGIYAFVTLNA